MITSTERLSVGSVSPEALHAVLGVEKFVRSGRLSSTLLNLVRIRSSQLNGCAFCLSMHHFDARQNGEKQSRLDMLSAWREAAGMYDEQEQAALRLTEEVTRIGEHGVSDEVWEAVTSAFPDEQDVVTLLMAIIAINVWNRIAVSTHQAPELHD